jgi:hypothetical protein
MRRFRDPYLKVDFEAASFPDGEVLRWRHKFLCTSNPHANKIIGHVVEQNDPFQRTTVIPLSKVKSELSSRPIG